MKFIYILIIIFILYLFISFKNIDEYINKEYYESNFLISKNKKPLQIGKKKIYYLKVPNNLIYYKNVTKKQKNIIFLDDYHTYCTEEEIKCNKRNYIDLLEFLRLFYKIKKKINLFIEVIHPSDKYKNYTEILIENTNGFNSNNTITTIVDDNIFKECFYRGKKCKNFKIISTDIRLSNDMLINLNNIYIKKSLSSKDIYDIIKLTLYTEKNLYYIIYNYLKNNNKEPKKKKKYIYKNLQNEVYIYYHKLDKRNKEFILDFIEKIYIPKIKSYNFIEQYIYMFMDLLTIMKILCVPKNEIIILYQGLHHNYFIRKFLDMYIKYDYKKRAEEIFLHKNKCIYLGEMDEIIT